MTTATSDSGRAGAYGTPALARALASPRPDEITACRALLRRDGLLGPDTHVAYFGLAEQDKRELLAGAIAPRRFRVMLIDLRTGRSHDAVVCPGEDRVVTARELDVATDGHVPVVLAEFPLVEEIVHRDERWLAAMRKRGLTDLSRLRVNPLSAGVAGEHESGRRLQRCFTFVQKTPDDLGWAHPVDGVTVVVDVVTREVLDVIDYTDLPVPDEDGNFHDPAWVGPTRAGLKPIEITQPQGPSFTIDEDGVISWLGWQLQVGFDQREGLVLHNISIDDGGRQRPVVYRASLAEMMVPYGDPSPQRWFQNFFDCGEYLLGGFANSLELGCDCVGDITYLDAVLADSAGEVRVIPQAICVHEEDTGILWKHYDNWNGSSQSRRNRRLVVSFFVTVGNYDYGFYWYFSLDGAIELEVKATGVVFTSAYPGPGYPFASELAPGLGAPYHQHLFSARLDMSVDGGGNAVDEVESAAVPRGPDNPTGTGFTQTVTRLRTESGAQRLADNTRNRSWLVVNPSVTNRFGNPVGYMLHPEGKPVLLADADSDIHRRAAYATRHLWVTPYAPDENYPAGDLVNMHNGGAGLPEWTAADRDVDNADIVLWHTFGLTHFPRPEDWPVMPVDSAGFVLKPYGFFDRNPTLDIPASTGDHCHPGAQHEQHEQHEHHDGHHGHHDHGKAGA
ncbi:primary-amine oxidase [Streptomyces sp. DvalAA-14]|uniref:primary-amine oxidase n=1 Tax=unclassified Streptomyces TaxID=2593676 RepID=UPI00081B3FEA|nr:MULTISPECIES: primary-amine oxidase [unclassified Streptomyces]MYS21095.1 primary-amine oxidase [Streptomyces sp. SID4948]SCD83994.1 primary-amine oxidase [Streptomyces sp. DvalAA-14]